jgi:hypothetical protein
MKNCSYRIAQLADVENVFNYESQLLNNADLEEIEKQILIWNSHFRKEALEHYFKTGWSFVAEDENKNICGFFMGQPMLFMNKQTQSLWVEYVSAVDNEIYTELVDIAYRLSREKHFQRVQFANLQAERLLKNLPASSLDINIQFIKTTK